MKEFYCHCDIGHYITTLAPIPVFQFMTSKQGLASSRIHFVVPTSFHYNRLGRHPSPLSNTTLETVTALMVYGISAGDGINILWSRQNGCHFADAFCEWMFLYESCCILIEMSSLSLRIHLTISDHWMVVWVLPCESEWCIYSAFGDETIMYSLEPDRCTGMIQYSKAVTSYLHIVGLVQDCKISSGLEMEILQSCTKPLIHEFFFLP